MGDDHVRFQPRPPLWSDSVLITCCPRRTAESVAHPGCSWSANAPAPVRPPRACRPAAPRFHPGSVAHADHAHAGLLRQRRRHLAKLPRKIRMNEKYFQHVSPFVHSQAAPRHGASPPGQASCSIAARGSSVLAPDCYAHVGSCGVALAGAPLSPPSMAKPWPADGAAAARRWPWCRPAPAPDRKRQRRGPHVHQACASAGPCIGWQHRAKLASHQGSCAQAAAAPRGHATVSRSARAGCSARMSYRASATSSTCRPSAFFQPRDGGSSHFNRAWGSSARSRRPAPALVLHQRAVAPGLGSASTTRPMVRVRA